MKNSGLAEGLDDPFAPHPLLMAASSSAFGHPGTSPNAATPPQPSLRYEGSMEVPLQQGVSTTSFSAFTPDAPDTRAGMPFVSLGGRGGARYELQPRRAAAPPGSPAADIVRSGSSASSTYRMSAALSMQPTSSELFTLQNTSSLQGAMSALVKAVVALSEDQKTLRTEFVALSDRSKQNESTTRTDTAAIWKTIREDLMTKKEFSEAKYDEIKKIERLIVRTSTLEEESARDKSILVSRISGLENSLSSLEQVVGDLGESLVTQVAFNEAVNHLDAEHASLEGNMIKQQKLFSLQCDQMAADVEEKHQEVTKATTGLRAAVDSHATQLKTLTEVVEANRDEVTHSAQKLNVATAGVQDRIDALTTASTERVSSALANLSEYCNGKIAECVASNEANQKMFESRVSMEASVLDLCVKSLGERVLHCEHEVAHAKSEVCELHCLAEELDEKREASVFDPRKDLSSLHSSVDVLQSQMESLQARLRQFGVEIEKERAARVDQHRSTLDAMREEAESNLKQFFLVREGTRENEIVGKIFTEFQNACDALSSKYRDELAALKDSLERKLLDVSQFCETTIAEVAEGVGHKLRSKTREHDKRMGEMSSSTDLLYRILCIQRGKVPDALVVVNNKEGESSSAKKEAAADETAVEDQPSDAVVRTAVKFIKSLPWYPVGAIRSPLAFSGGRARSPKEPSSSSVVGGGPSDVDKGGVSSPRLGSTTTMGSGKWISPTRRSGFGPQIEPVHPNTTCVEDSSSLLGDNVSGGGHSMELQNRALRAEVSQLKGALSTAAGMLRAESRASLVTREGSASSPQSIRRHGKSDLIRTPSIPESVALGGSSCARQQRAAAVEQ